MNAKSSRRRKRGTVIVVTLVCLVIVMGMIASMLSGSLRARRQLHAERDRRQAELLLQAGVDRAIFKIAKDAEYRGESWQLPADSVLGSGEGAVTITASRQADDHPWQFLVVAEYPIGSPISVRRSRTFIAPSNTP